MFHVKHEGWDLARALDLELNSQQLEKLMTFEALIRERAIPLGMVARADEVRLRERHVQDSLRAATAVSATDRTAYDLGSGAGLPGVVVAIACPDLDMTLVESRRPRAAFLQLVVDRLGLTNTVVSNERVETLREPVDLCFSRAFARVGVAWRAAERLLLPGGRLIYFAGERFDRSELPEDAKSTLVRTSALARSGPLVIMSRQ
ncbi:MAG: 16S rRNA (guanine(527)-N(7))-methyltransferase RsmG [Actinomycetota bacterium]